MHDEHAEGAFGTDDRHAEERVVRVFARFGAIREALVVRRVGDVERLRGFGHQADETFAVLQPRAVDSFGLQTFSREELVDGAARQIDRAHVRDHGRCNHRHEAVEALLRHAPSLHDLPQFAQEDPGAADIRRTSHRDPRFLRFSWPLLRQRPNHRPYVGLLPQVPCMRRRSTRRF